MLSEKGFVTVAGPDDDAGRDPWPGHFRLDDEDAYRRWREGKLRAPAGDPANLVEIGHPHALTTAERDALVARCGEANMVFYCCSRPLGPAGVRDLGRQLGLERLDLNLCARADGIAAIQVVDHEQTRDEVRDKEYVPYTNHSLNWHTDGYYNRPREQVRGVIMHCERPATRGGENLFMDPEIAYILLRDEDPALVAALAEPDVMTIPANRDGDRLIRPTRGGPVFSVHPGDGSLHMRYTARRRWIRWKDDPLVQGARASLGKILDESPAHVTRLRLEAGQGIICNNVLHARTAFDDPVDSDGGRLLWRARFYDRVAAR
jgi:alpha-ketoglutarate-dependent taurine dioxygenase